MTDDELPGSRLQPPDEELMATTIEPLLEEIFARWEEAEGAEAIAGLSPIDVEVTITLRSGERTLSTSRIETRVDWKLSN